MFKNKILCTNEIKTFILRTGEFKSFFTIKLEIPPLQKTIIERDNKYIINFLY